MIPFLQKAVEYYCSYAHLIEYTSRFESCSKIYWCFNVLLIISAWLMSSFVLVLRNSNKENCLIQSITNPRTNLGHFKIHCALQGLHFLIKPDESTFVEQIQVTVCLCACINKHCTNGFTATFICWGALNQMDITSKILNRLLFKWGVKIRVNKCHFKLCYYDYDETYGWKVTGCCQGWGVTFCDVFMFNLKWINDHILLNITTSCT